MRPGKARSPCHSEYRDTALMQEVVVVLIMQVPRSATQHTRPGEQALQSQKINAWLVSDDPTQTRVQATIVPMYQEPAYRQS